MTLYTVGHSNMLFGEFLAMLRAHGVQTVVDVRTSPYSRHATHFNKSDLSASLAQAGLRYVYEGRDLGGRPEDASCYRSRQAPEEGADYLREVDYAVVMRRPWFLKGVERLLRHALAGPTAVMCSESDPMQCHRHHLIAAYLSKAHPSVVVLHIVEGGAFAAGNLPSVADQASVRQLELFE